MKKILLSVATIGVVGAIVAGATGAWFSDTETSTGNTFTAGAIDLKVDSEQHYNGSICTLNVHGDDPATWSWNMDGTGGYPVKGTACDGSWAETDLGIHKFFNFGDIKPGDNGEDTISLHVIDNDAWVKMGIDKISDLDNTCMEPEAGTLTEACTVTVPEGTAVGMGELGENMKFRAWIDDGSTEGWQGKGRDRGEGDNIWQEGEVFIGQDSTQEGNGWMTISALDLALATTPAWSVLAGQTVYLGMEWDLPSTEGNITQTDSLGFDVMFEAIQQRNNMTSPYGLTI